jgi:hypothetical protein
MKKLNYLFIFLMLFLYGCPDPDPDFVGSWEFQTSDVERYVNDVFVKDTLYTYDSGELWIEFGKDEKGILHQNNVVFPFTWSESDGIISLKYPQQCVLFLEYTLSGQSLEWIVKTCVQSNYPNTGDTYYEIRTETTTRM